LKNKHPISKHPILIPTIKKRSTSVPMPRVGTPVTPLEKKKKPTKKPTKKPKPKEKLPKDYLPAYPPTPIRPPKIV